MFFLIGEPREVAIFFRYRMSAGKMIDVCQ
jgi:hypothetical protein